MDEDGLERRVLWRVPLNRRQFVKRLAVGSAFAAPVIASFSMEGLTINQASAQVANSGP